LGVGVCVFGGVVVGRAGVVRVETYEKGVLAAPQGEVCGVVQGPAVVTIERKNSVLPHTLRLQRGHHLRHAIVQLGEHGAVYFVYVENGGVVELHGGQRRLHAQLVRARAALVDVLEGKVHVQRGGGVVGLDNVGGAPREEVTVVSPVAAHAVAGADGGAGIVRPVLNRAIVRALCSALGAAIGHSVVPGGGEGLVGEGGEEKAKISARCGCEAARTSSPRCTPSNTHKRCRSRDKWAWRCAPSTPHPTSPTPRSCIPRLATAKGTA